MNSNRDVKLSAFLAVYFYTIENKLNESDNKLKSLKFQSEESNTDEFLKRYFQEFLLKNKDIKKATLKSISIESGKKKYHFSIKDLFSFSIKKVLLPEQLSKKQKLEISKTKKSVFTNPDLYLEINDGKQSYFESVELKSTKNNKMRGSSVQQVVPFEWVIFIKRNKENVNVTTGHYINSITEKLPFPDRSPRPQIAFNNLKNWNKKNRKLENEILSISNSPKLNKEKIQLLQDWQNYLASEWLEIIKSSEVKKNEKWFNHALRKFAIKFLDYSESLTQNEKAALKKNLKSLTT